MVTSKTGPFGHRTVARDSKTGKIVSKKTAARRPKTTQVEKVRPGLQKAWIAYKRTKAYGSFFMVLVHNGASKRFALKIIYRIFEAGYKS